MSGYQQLAPLRPEERDALKADIERRGVLVPVEIDENGAILDGFNRSEIAHELGIEFPTVVRSGWTEQEKLEHAIKINMLRRHLSPVAWGDAFRKLLTARGVSTGPGARNDKRTSATVAEVAEELGVPERTAYFRMSAAKELETHPDLFDAADSGQTTVKDAVQEKRKRERTNTRNAKEQAREVAPMLDLPAWLEVADATKLPMSDGVVDLIVTSPPYGLDKPYQGILDEANGWREFMADWMAEAYRVSKQGGRLALNVPLDVTRPFPRATYMEAVAAALEAGWSYRWTIVWNEGNVNKSVARGSVDSPSAPHVITPVEMIPVFFKGDWARDTSRESDLTHAEWLEWTNGLWTFPGESRPWMGHPAPFPPELPRRLIKLLSYREDTVLDPFNGSGTTTRVGWELGREMIGFDQSADYVQQAQQRLAEAIHARA